MLLFHMPHRPQVSSHIDAFFSLEQPPCSCMVLHSACVLRSLHSVSPSGRRASSTTLVENIELLLKCCTVLSRHSEDIINSKINSIQLIFRKRVCCMLVTNLTATDYYEPGHISFSQELRLLVIIHDSEGIDCL